MSKINTEMMQFHKPSELTQVIFVDGAFKKEFKLYNISPTEIDLMNSFYYEIRKRIIQNKIAIPEDGSTVFEFQFKQISDMIGKYKHGEYAKILEHLDSLANLKMVINVLGKNKDVDVFAITNFLQEIKISKHKTTETKKVKLTMSNTLINSFLCREKLFAKMFLKLQLSLTSKYSKLLYEILKDYVGIHKKELSMENLINLLNVTTENQTKWLYFNQNILKKTVSEINEKTDIIVSYEPIKEKKEGQRKQVTSVLFQIDKQTDSRLQELGLIQPSMDSQPFYNKSKTKLDSLVKNGYKVADIDSWIKADITKNEERYDCETRIDVWLKETPQDIKNMIFEQLATEMDDCYDRTVFIKDYLIYGIFSNEIFTKSAKETLSLVNSIINSMTE